MDVPPTFYAFITLAAFGVASYMALMVEAHATMRRLRKQQGVSQSQMAALMGRDQAWVSHTERGNYSVSVADYVARCEALGARIDLDPLPDADVARKLAAVIAMLDADQVEALLLIARIMPRLPDRVVHGLVLFAESQAQADDTSG